MYKNIRTPAGNDRGFTLIELLVVMVVSSIVMGILFATFKLQQNSYTSQTKISNMQQNLRSAMFILSDDLRMAGFYTKFDTSINTVSGSGSAVAITKADDTITTLTSGQFAAEATNVIDFQLGSDPGLTAGQEYILLKKDLNYAERFTVSAPGPTTTVSTNFSKTFQEGDMIITPVTVTYTVTTSADFDGPVLIRNGQPVAENISAINCVYTLADGTQKTDPTADEFADARAVQITLTSNVAVLPGNTKNRYLVTTVNLRNLSI